MQQKTEQEELLIRFLFGDLSKEEQSQIEERFFDDNQYFEQLLAVEDALIDDYLAGELASYERKKFEALMSSSHLQMREIEFVKGLVNDLKIDPTEATAALRTQAKPRSKWHSLLERIGLRVPNKLILLAALLLIAFSIPILVWNLVLQNKLEQIQLKQAEFEMQGQGLRQEVNKQSSDNEELIKQLEDERNRRAQLEEEVAHLQQSSVMPTAEVASIALSEDSVSRSGGQSRTVYIRPNTRQLRIDMDVSKQNKSGRYRVVIKTFNGRQIWSKDRIGAAQINSGRLVLLLPTSLFESDDFILTLKEQVESGDFADVGDYSFRVRR